MTGRSQGRAAVIGSLVPVLVALAACAPEPGAGTAIGEATVVVDNAAPPEMLPVDRGSLTHNGATRVFSGDHLERTTGDRVSVTTPHGTLQTRSVREFSLAPVTPGAPLIERMDHEGRPLPGWGVVEDDAGFLGQLMNTGWITALPDGGAVFAHALEPEVIRFNEDGREVWRSRRPAPAAYDKPVLVKDGSSIRPDFTEVQHGVARGPDGRLYVLAGATADSVRIDVLDRNGKFVRAGWVPRKRDISVDERGRVAIGAPPSPQLAGERRAYADFDLPPLDGDHRIRLSDYHGRVVVINVWASWCGPCRLEMPALDSLAAEIDSDAVVVLGLNDDVDPDAARRFVRELGGVGYPLAAGEGRLRERLGLRGLPYTVVLDASHRIVEEIYGFGGRIDPVRRAIETAVASASSRESP